MTSNSRPFGLFLLTQTIDFFTSAAIRNTLYFLITLPIVVAISFSAYTIQSTAIQVILGGILLIIWILSLVVSYGPIVSSVIAYTGNGSGHRVTKMALGAREPSRRERERIISTQKLIVEAGNSNNIQVKGLSGMFMVDTPLENVYLIGTALYISTGALNSSHFDVMLAHEMGHNQNGDGATILALRRLVFPLSYVFIGNVKDFSTARANFRESVPERPEFNFRTPDLRQFQDDPARTFYSMINSVIFFLFSLIGGGLGVWITSWGWSRHFKERDFMADQFVVACGMKDSLIEYLEQNRFYDTSVPFMLSWRPANEQRIDRILNPADYANRSRSILGEFKALINKLMETDWS